MWIVVSSRYCARCKRHFELREMPIGRVQIPDGERIFFRCPNCSEEIPDIPVCIEHQNQNTCE